MTFRFGGSGSLMTSRRLWQWQRWLDRWPGSHHSRSLFPTDVVRPLTRQLRAFQDTLGGLQDLVVQTQTLTETLKRVEAQDGNHIQVAASVGGLLHELSRRRPRLMVDFRDCIRPFHKRTRGADVERVFTGGLGGKA